MSADVAALGGCGSQRSGGSGSLLSFELCQRLPPPATVHSPRQFATLVANQPPTGKRPFTPKEADRYTASRVVEGVFRGAGVLLFGVGLTWLLTVVVGRAVTRRGLALWVWGRSGSIGRVLIAVGFGLCVVGLSQSGASAPGSSLLLLGALLGMAGIWLILPGP